MNDIFDHESVETTDKDELLAAIKEMREDFFKLKKKFKKSKTKNEQQQKELRHKNKKLKKKLKACNQNNPKKATRKTGQSPWTAFTSEALPKLLGVAVSEAITYRNRTQSNLPRQKRQKALPYWREEDCDVRRH